MVENIDNKRTSRTFAAWAIYIAQPKIDLELPFLEGGGGGVLRVLK